MPPKRKVPAPTRKPAPTPAQPAPDAPTFFMPLPKVRRLTERGLLKIEESLFEGCSDEIRCLIDEVRTIRDRELSVFERGTLEDLRAELSRIGRQQFVDIVDRVIEILETER